jgi:hypothetical protein
MPSHDTAVVKAHLYHRGARYCQDTASTWCGSKPCVYVIFITSRPLLSTHTLQRMLLCTLLSDFHPHLPLLTECLETLPARGVAQSLVSTSYSSHPGRSVRTVTGPPSSRWLLGRRKRESRDQWWICVNKGALADNDGQHVRTLQMKSLRGTIQIR